MTIQENQQVAIRADSGTALDYNSDFISLMHADLSVTTGTFNELLIAWLQLKLGSSRTDLPGLKAEAAANAGVDSWNLISDVTAVVNNLLKEDGDFILLEDGDLLILE